MRYPRFLKYLSENRFQQSDGLPYWRERIFNGILLAIFVFGTLAIFPNLIAALNAGMYPIFFLDSLIFLTVLVVVFVRKISLNVKVYILIFSFYLLGIFLLVTMGPFGPGLIWIVCCSVLIALMLNFKKTLFSIAFNFLIVLILALLIHFKVADTPFFSAYTTFSWVAIGLNVIVISAVCSIPVSILIQGLEKTVNEEKELKQQLIEKNQQLSEEMVKAKEADKLKSSFLANLSHEIRTPMNAIAGFSELTIMEENLPENIKKYAEQIFINSDYLQSIINDIVDISLIEAGQIKIQEENFSLKQLMYEISIFVDSMLLRKKKPDLEILFPIDDNLSDASVFSDKKHIKQILINFISNSLKYTNQGSIEIGYKSIDGKLVFHVRDSGMGIPESEKIKIFSRFSSVDHKNGLLIPGMGIGLSIAKGLSDALGGKIWFESEEDKGSCFYFLIPKN
jgi:signal transduction histidine kinase